jgi:PAS/PAC sensor signal transduction histidine kinase
MIDTKKSKSVFFRIFTTSAILGAAIIAVFAVATYGIIDRAYVSNVQRMLDDSAELVAEAIGEEIPLANISKMCARHDAKSGIRTTVIDAEGKVVLDSRADSESMPNHLNRSEVKRALDGELNFATRYSNTLKTRMVYIAVPAGRKTSEGYSYCVRQSIPMTSILSAKKIFVAEILVLSCGAILTAAFFSYLLARRISRPLRELSAAAFSYSSGNFDVPVPYSDITEICRLGATVSAMAKDLKKRISSLYKRNCELDEIFEHMADCVFICSKKGVVKKYNRACAALFGIAENAEKIGVAETFRNSGLIGAIDEIFRDGGEVSREIEISPERIFALVGTMLPYESATPRALFVMRDISFSKKNEALRREFVAGVSHELKTPITAIKMAAETLEYSGGDAAASKRFVKIIAKESERMNTLVDDMLLLSKIEFTKKFDAENFETFSMRSLIDEAVSIHESEALRRGDFVEISCPPELEMRGDFTLAQIAVSNLVGNAVKYGGERVKIRISAERNGKDGVKITVSDTGAGIPPKDIPHIFERFYRVDKGRSRAMGGTGLGLAIVKHVALLHKGGVSVKSELGKGSEFSITFA